MTEKLTQLVSSVLDVVVPQVYAQIQLPEPTLGPDPGTSVFASMQALVAFVLNLIFAVGLALALVFVIYGGIKYVTSAGDQTKAEEARGTITNALIGAVVIIAFRVLIDLVLSLFGLGTLTELFGEVNQ